MKKLILTLAILISCKVVYAEVEPVLIRTLTEVTGGGLSVTGSTVAVYTQNVTTVTFNGISQPVTFSGVSTVTFNNLTQPVKILESTVPIRQVAFETWSVQGPFATSSITFIAAGNGTSVDVSTRPLKNYSLLVYSNNGTATSWSIDCEGSLDNVNFTKIVRHKDGTVPLGNINFSGANVSPSLYFRTKVNNVVLGGATSITAICLGN